MASEAWSHGMGHGAQQVSAPKHQWWLEGTAEDAQQAVFAVKAKKQVNRGGAHEGGLEWGI